MVSLVLKPLIPILNVIPDLLAVLTFPQNVILINYSRGFCSPPMRSSAMWALSIHLCGKTLVILSPPTPAKRRYPGLKIILSFLLLITSLLPHHSFTPHIKHHANQKIKVHIRLKILPLYNCIARILLSQ